MKPYPAYKDSGIECIGSIPEHWEILKTKNIGQFSNGYPYKSSEWMETGLPVIRMSNISKLGYLSIENNVKCISLESAKKTQQFLIQKQDILIAMTDMTRKMSLLGKTIVFDREGEYYLNQRVGRIRIDGTKAIVGFFYYASNSDALRQQIKSEGYPSVQCNVSPQTIRNCFLPYPPIGEQRRIRKYLDHKTRLIDTLIEKKQKQIELLKNQRAAVINQAVTKGLNPVAKMKDSGIAWLGEVPEHWEIRKAKYLFGLSLEKAPENNNLELLSVYTDIGVRPRKELTPRGNKASTTDGYLLVKKGDIIVNKPLAWKGAIGYSNYDGVTSPTYAILRKTKSLNSKYYHYLFRGGLYLPEFRRRSRGVMDVNLMLYFEEFGQILLPHPPKNEQNRIVEYIDAKVENLKSLIDKQLATIKLLIEYRATLISNVITGKIDVRYEVI